MIFNEEASLRNISNQQESIVVLCHQLITKIFMGFLLASSLYTEITDSNFWMDLRKRVKWNLS